MASISEKNNISCKITDDCGDEAFLSYYHEDSNWNDLNAVDIYFFKNPYLNKEVYNYEIHLNDNNERAGFIFPITTIESEEKRTGSIKNYLWLAFRLLIEKIDNVDPGKTLLSQYFDDELFVLVLHKETVRKIDADFNIQNYIFSFASFGFYYLEDLKKLSIFKVSKAYKAQFFDYSKKTLTILGTVYPEGEEQLYVKSLFSELLRTDTNILSRFILLYQVIELEMDRTQNSEIVSAIDDFSNNRIRLNDLKVRISKASNELSNITQIFENNTINEYVKAAFQNECQSLYNDVGYSSKTDWNSIFYSLRNNIVHSYSLFIEHKDALDRTILNFEKVIIDLIIKINKK